MAIVKKNTYVAGSNNDLTNVVLNIDLQRLGMDLTNVTYSAPNFLIKAGSLIEANGSLYAVEGSDISVTASTGVLIFDSATLLFSISASAYAYDATKAGEYITGQPTKRVCRWNLSSNGDFYNKTNDNTYNWYNKPRLIGSKSGTDTQNNWFDYFAPFLPLTNDETLATGGWGAYTNIIKMTRTSATVITLTGWTYDTSTVTTQTLTDGNASNLTGAISI